MASDLNCTIGGLIALDHPYPERTVASRPAPPSTAARAGALAVVGAGLAGVAGAAALWLRARRP